MGSVVSIIADRVRERVRREGVDLGERVGLAERYAREEVRRYSERALGGSLPLLLLLRSSGSQDRHVEDAVVGEPFGPLESFATEWAHVLPEGGLVELAASHSYVITLPEGERAALLHGADWKDVFPPHTPLLEIIVDGTITYFAICALLRVVFKRQTSGIEITDTASGRWGAPSRSCAYPFSGTVADNIALGNRVARHPERAARAVRSADSAGRLHGGHHHPSPDDLRSPTRARDGLRTHRRGRQPRRAQSASGPGSTYSAVIASAVASGSPARSASRHAA